jgi:hypothetical protein
MSTDATLDEYMEKKETGESERGNAKYIWKVQVKIVCKRGKNTGQMGGQVDEKLVNQAGGHHFQKSGGRLWFLDQNPCCQLSCKGYIIIL